MFTEKEAGRSVVLLLCALFVALLISGVKIIDLVYFGVLLFCYLRLKLTKKC